MPGELGQTAFLLQLDRCRQKWGLLRIRKQARGFSGYPLDSKPNPKTRKKRNMSW
jgi:hypothetical protein